MASKSDCAMASFDSQSHPQQIQKSNSMNQMMPSHNHFSMPSQQHSFHGPPQIAQSHTQPSQHRMVAVSNSKNSERNAFQSQSHHSAPHFGGHSKSNSVQMHSQKQKQNG